MPTRLTIDRLTSFLVAEDIPYETDRAEEGIITFGIKGDVGEYDMAFDLDGQEGLLICFTQTNPPLSITADHLPRLYGAIGRINHALPLGSFKLDPAELALSYVHGMCVEEAECSDAQLATMVIDSVEEFERYLPAIQKVMEGQDAAEVIATVEEDLHS